MSLATEQSQTDDICVALYENITATKAIVRNPSWETFCHNMKSAKISDIKEVGLFGPHKIGGNGSRKNDNITEITAFVFDIDNAPGHTCASILGLVSNYAAIAHTTWSHSPEEPRFRLVLQLRNPIAVADFHAVRDAFLAAHPGLAAIIDKVCKDFARFYYLYSYPEERVGFSEFMVNEGEPIDPKAFLPLTTPAPSQVTSAMHLSISGMPLIRPRSEATKNILQTSESPEEIGKLRAALARLSPDTARGSGRFYDHNGRPEDDYWMAVIWAIASLQWACGEALARDWSKGSPRYSDDGFEHAWSQFNPSLPNHIGVGSLYKRASEMGCLQAGTNVGIPAIKGIPQRLPGELKLVTAFDPALFPQSIRAGVVDISERLNCSIDYVAIAVLAGAGAVLGNSVGVWPKEHDETWIVHPSLWGGIVGSPGSMKTPALNAALKPVHDLEEIAATKYKTDYLAYTKAMADYEKAMNSGSGSIPQVPAKPIKKRYTVNDVTYQALGLLLADNPQGILALSDELSGLLQSLDTQGQEAARGFFLSGWGGQGFYTFDRIGRGPVSLTRYSVAVFGGFQPDRIRAYVRSAQGGSTQNDGLLQRFQLLVWPDQPATFILIDRPANKAALSSMHQAITNIDILSKLGITGATRINSGLQLLHFAPDAQLVFNKWLHANEVLLRSGTLSSSESSHFAKYRSLIPALALLFHLLDGNQDLIKLEYLEAAIGFSEYLQSHAKRIYASINGQDHAPIRALAGKLISGGVSDGFTQRSLLHKGWANLSKEASVKMALDALVEYGWLTENESINPGRKTTIYTINANIGAHLL